MAARILDGKSLAADLRAKLAAGRGGAVCRPRPGAFRVGRGCSWATIPRRGRNVAGKGKACAAAGIYSRPARFAGDRDTR
jgi:hypothetical protein